MRVVKMTDLQNGSLTRPHATDVRTADNTLPQHKCSLEMTLRFTHSSGYSLTKQPGMVTLTPPLADPCKTSSHQTLEQQYRHCSSNTLRHARSSQERGCKLHNTLGMLPLYLLHVVSCPCRGFQKDQPMFLSKLLTLFC